MSLFTFVRQFVRRFQRRRTTQTHGGAHSASSGAAIVEADQ